MGFETAISQDVQGYGSGVLLEEEPAPGRTKTPHQADMSQVL